MYTVRLKIAMLRIVVEISVTVPEGSLADLGAGILAGIPAPKSPIIP
jgi:hypothetical protein